jgi:hypothetical protein
MVLEYYRQPETGEKWLKIRHAGATSYQLYKPLTDYVVGWPVVYLDRDDRAELDRLEGMGLHPKTRATRSDVYTLRHFGRYGVSVESNAHTTTREPRATLVLASEDCYEFVKAIDVWA